MKTIGRFVALWAVALGWGSPAFAVVTLVDDFSSTAVASAGGFRLAGGTGVITADYLSVTTAAKPLGLKNYSLALTYDASTPGDFLYFVISFSNPEVNQNLSAYTYLSFWIRGAAGGEGLQAGLGNTSFQDSRVQINDHLPQGITTEWQKVVIPFSVLEMGGIISRSAVSKIVFIVDQGLLYGAAAGTVYLDDLVIGASAAPVWIDNYNSGSDPNACLGNNPAYGDNLTFGYSTEAFASAPYAMKFTYLLPASQGTLVHLLKSASAVHGVDAAGCTHLQFDVRGLNGGENPTVRLVSATQSDSRSLASYGTVSASGFGTVAIPFADLTNLTSLVDMRECDFDVTTGMQSGFYLDNLAFVDRSIPAAPTGITFAGTPVSDGFVITAQSGRVEGSASSLNGDARMEQVEFAYSADAGTTWVTIGHDYATAAAKTVYGADWDASGLSNGPYRLRAVSRHVGGTSAQTAFNVTLNFGTPTHTPTVTATPTVTPTLTPSASVTTTPTITQTSTTTPTLTPSASITATPTVTLTATETPVLSPTPSSTVTATPTTTPTPTISPSPTVSPTSSVTPVVTSTPTAPPVVNAFQVGLNQFNPNAGQTLPLRLSTQESGQLAIRIYNRNGRLVRNLADRPVASGETVLSWDGRTDGGVLVPSGVYVIVVEAPGRQERRLVAVIQ